MGKHPVPPVPESRPPPPKDPEVHSLRQKCQFLEKEAKELEHTKKRLESRLLVLHKQLCLEGQLVRQLKDRRGTELKTLRKDYIDKFETAMNLLKVRVQVEMSQSLRRHKEQLKMSFRSDLLKLTQKNCQLTNLLRYIQQLQQLEKDSQVKRRTFCCARNNQVVETEKDEPQREQGQEGGGVSVSEGGSYSSAECCHTSQKREGICYSDPQFQGLRTEFQKQIRKLLDELKEREDGINELNRNVQTISHPQQLRSASAALTSPQQLGSSLASSSKKTSPEKISTKGGKLSGGKQGGKGGGRHGSSFSTVPPHHHHQHHHQHSYYNYAHCGDGHSNTLNSEPATSPAGNPAEIRRKNNSMSELLPPPDSNSVGPVRNNKNHRGTRESRTSPYDTNLAGTSRRKRCNAVSSAQFLPSENEKGESLLDSTEQPEEESTHQQQHKRKDGRTGTTMRELDIPHVTAIDCNSQSSYYGGHPQHHQHNPYHNNQNVGHHHHQYHQQCGGPGLLETLPEAESEEEEDDDCESISPTGGKNEELYGITRSPLVTSESPSSSSSSSSASSSSSNDSSSPRSEFPPEFTSLLESSFGRNNKLQVAKSLEDFGILQQCEVENQKISVLESIIRQLRDELKECKDQNELLEFRLLEMQELSSSPVRAHQLDEIEEEEVVEEEDSTQENMLDGDADESHETSKDVVSCLPPSAAEAEYERGNGHANVTESRSSCSDCSESLSLQESGIFDSQSTEDSPVTNICRLTISRELVSLTFQIEELLRRFNEGVDETGSGSGSPFGGALDSLCVSTRRGKTSHDLASELQSCRQRIQEFERRLAAMSDGNYIQGLEEKVNFLLHENRRLEDERAEIEEAENDNRLMCQRLEEKLGQLQKKKLVLQNRLSAEKKCIEQLRLQILQTQEHEEDLCSQITRLEGLLQNYEQRNFELEESCIEMKCSVQFVINSIPIFALCYYGALWRGGPNQVNRPGIPSFLLRLPPAIVNRYLQCRNALPPAPDAGVASLAAPSRKHKLGELLESTSSSSSTSFPEDVEPKLKKLRRILDISGITCICDCAKCGDNRSNEGETSLMSATTSAESQTGEELWRELVEQMFAQQKNEWGRAERVLLKKIEILECDIDKCQEIFDQERGNLIKLYEGKLAEKESQLKETQACRNEKRDLQEKWNCLIQELEQFALYLGKNLSERAEVDSYCLQREMRKEVENSPSAYSLSRRQQELTTMSPNFISAEASSPIQPDDGEEKLPSFINSTAAPVKRKNDSEMGEKRNETEVGAESEMEQKTRLISSLQTSLREHLSTFERRENHLLSEIDRLTKEIKESRKEDEDSEHQGNMIAYLTQENERLMSLFQDHEKVWGDLQQLQEEHEKLKLEAGNIAALRKKLEDSSKMESEMRDRLDELERTESSLKTQITQIEKKEQKGLEKIQQLRDEIQFLRTKCCQLQDDIDGRVSRESKYKSEIQALTQKLKESSLELEEKESQLESNESALQTQIQKLKNQLGELHQAYGDAECSNGMLREEVSYLERTVEEAIEKAVQSENTVTALSHELKQKDLTIEELRRKLEHLTTCESMTAANMMLVSSSSSASSASSPLSLSSALVSSSAMSPNDLADFNKNDGGLHGVARDVEEVVTLLQRCTQCEKLGTKLMDIVERLIVLIQILKTSQLPDETLHGPIDSLSRCESEEVLNPCVSIQTITEEDQGKDRTDQKKRKNVEHTEEEDLMISKLQETMTNLSLQIRNLEDAFYIRQKETRESYLTETTWWKFRCEEKNKLLEVLGRRIAQLCVTDIHGYFLEGILMEIKKVRDSIGNSHLVQQEHHHHHHQLSLLCNGEELSSSLMISSSPSNSSSTSSSSCSLPPLSPDQYFCPIEPPPRRRSSKKKGKVTRDNKPKSLLPKDFTCESLCSYLRGERKRVMTILEDAMSEETAAVDGSCSACGDGSTPSTSGKTWRENGSNISLEGINPTCSADYPSSSGLEFRVLRKIGDDSLLVCWSLPEQGLLSEEQVNGYEISVNGEVYLRIPQPKRHKVVLFGLNFDEPLRLTLKCSPSLEESTITYIN